MMTRLNGLLAVLFGLTLATAGAPSASWAAGALPFGKAEVRLASPAVSAVHGVFGYTISRSATTVRVRLHRIDRSSFGVYLHQATVEPLAVFESISSHDGSFTNEFRDDGTEKTVTLRDRSEAVTLIADFERKEWVGDRQAAERIFSRHTRLVELAEAVKADIGIGGPSSPDVACTRSTSVVPSAVGPPIVCESLPRCYNSAYATRRSQACGKAKQNAAYCCTNDYCWGCCGFDPPVCDCMCVINPD